MKRANYLASVALGAILTTVLTDGSEAARMSFAVTEISAIESPEGAGRVFLDFGVIEGLGQKWISSAFLHLPLAGAATEEDVEMQAFAVTTAWVGRSPTWTRPWERPGGDFEASSPSLTLEKGQGGTRVRMNVTDEIRAMIRGERSSYGLALSVPPWKGEGFSAKDREVLGSLEGASLVITYVSTGLTNAIEDSGTPR